MGRNQLETGRNVGDMIMSHSHGSTHMHGGPRLRHSRAPERIEAWTPDQAAKHRVPGLGSAAHVASSSEKPQGL